MNDLEDLVREELRARVAAAEARQPDEPPVVLLGRLSRRIRRAGLRRRWGAAALSAVAIGVAIALPVELLSSGIPAGHPRSGTRHGAVPLTDTAATPSGWAAVAYGEVQLSVPADWRVASRPVCGGAAPGYIVLAPASTSLVVRNPRCKQAANMAAIQLLPSGQGNTRRRTGEINGVPVLGVRPVARGYVTFLLPTLHALVTLRGPLFDKVEGTLTRSPLSVVLAPGRQFPVPPSWRWHDFRGVSFATPAGWTVVRDGHWGCPYYMARETVVLIPGANSQRPRCGALFPLATARLVTGHLGVIAGAGPYRGPDSSGYHRCRVLHGLRACYWAHEALLDLAVFVPGRDRATVVQIGLGGNGATARTIFESIRRR